MPDRLSPVGPRSTDDLHRSIHIHRLGKPRRLQATAKLHNKYSNHIKFRCPKNPPTATTANKTKTNCILRSVVLLIINTFFNKSSIYIFT